MGTTTIGIICIILVMAILFQIAKASELTSIIKGGEDEKLDAEGNYVLQEGTPGENQGNGNAIMSMIFVVGFLVLTVWSAWYYRGLYLPEPSSVHGMWIRNMFFWTLVATVPVFLITNFVLFYFAYKYRARKGHKAYHYAENNRLEVIWTVIPAIVMVLLVFEGMRSWLKITAPAPEDAIVIEATAQQFNWTLRYSGEDNDLGKKSVKYIDGENTLGQNWLDKPNYDDFITDTLFIPVNRPVQIKINSIDVLHSFYLPHFRVKMDAVPGIPTQFWFIPTKTTEDLRKLEDNPNFNYELACAELCGQAHFNMRKPVYVGTEAEYQAWLKRQKPTIEKLGGNKYIKTFEKKLEDIKKKELELKQDHHHHHGDDGHHAEAGEDEEIDLAKL